MILDFDATDDPVHGEQDGRFFHGFYRHYCFLPLYVFCGHQLLVSYLRPSNIDGAKHSWDKPRRVIAKIEYSAHGVNPRYVVTNLAGDAKHLYDKLYCARGDMENRIKENQLDMFGDRTSCQHWWPNPFRLLLSSLAYTLIEAIRRIVLKGTELAKAYVGTIRLKLFKIGAVILKNACFAKLPR